METEYGFEPFIENTLRDKLKGTLARKQAANPAYSLRALARDLDVSHSALSEFINGRRKFSQSLCESIIAKLSLPQSEQEKLSEAQKHNPLNFTHLSNEEIHLAREWYVPALAELVKVENFSADPQWIAKALGLDVELTKKAIEKLIALGWIEIDANGKWRIAEENTSTLGSLDAKADILHTQQQFTDFQSQAIQSGICENSSVTGITFAIDPADLPKARKLAYEFISNMSELLEKKSAHKKEVYRMNVALFPISKATET